MQDTNTDHKKGACKRTEKNVSKKGVRKKSKKRLTTIDSPHGQIQGMFLGAKKRQICNRQNKEVELKIKGQKLG